MVLDLLFGDLETGFTAQIVEAGLNLPGLQVVLGVRKEIPADADDSRQQQSLVKQVAKAFAAEHDLEESGAAGAALPRRQAPREDWIRRSA